MEDNLASFLERFFKPQFVGAFHGPTVRVAVFRTADSAATEIITLHNFYPFLTFTDLKTAIYMEKKKDPDFYPFNAFWSLTPQSPLKTNRICIYLRIFFG